MAEVAEALGAALAARYRWDEPRRPITHGQGRNARLNRLQKAFGGNRREAAKAAGIPYSTWGHMLAGRNVSPRNLRKLEAAFTRIVMLPAMAAAVAKHGYPKEWHVSAVVVGDPQGTRYINGHPAGVSQRMAAPLGPPAWRTFRAEGINGKPIVNAWLNHGDEAAAQALGQQVKRSYGQEFGFEGNAVEVEVSGRQR